MKHLFSFKILDLSCWNLFVAAVLKLAKPKRNLSDEELLDQTVLSWDVQNSFEADWMVKWQSINSLALERYSIKELKADIFLLTRKMQLAWFSFD